MTAHKHNPAGPILVGIDGSPEAYNAVRWAASEAELRARPLHLLHAKEWPVAGAPMWPVWGLDMAAALDEGARAMLEQANELVADLAPKVETTTIIVDGAASSALLQASEAASITVVGRRGRGGFGNLLLGSTALHVSRHATGAVAVVPLPVSTLGSTQDSAAQRYVTTGIDGSDHSQTTLAWAFEEASLRGVPLRAVRAWNNPVLDAPAFDLPFVPLDSDLVAEQERVLSETMAGWAEKYPDVQVERLVRSKKHPVRALLEASKYADVLVVGARGEGGFAGLLLGSVSESLVRHAPCPVLVVRTR